jgi:hypothetical protein
LPNVILGEISMNYKNNRIFYTEVMPGTDLKCVVYFAYLIFRNGHVSQHKVILITYIPMPGSRELGVANSAYKEMFPNILI